MSNAYIQTPIVIFHAVSKASPVCPLYFQMDREHIDPGTHHRLERQALPPKGMRALARALRNVGGEEGGLGFIVSQHIVREGDAVDDLVEHVKKGGVMGSFVGAMVYVVGDGDEVRVFHYTTVGYTVVWVPLRPCVGDDAPYVVWRGKSTLCPMSVGDFLVILGMRCWPCFFPLGIWRLGMSYWGKWLPLIFNGRPVWRA